MEMHQIRYFIAVAKNLNFTRAAEECNVAQPSLTRAIKNLELELGGELFRRERASSHLTNLGRTMLPMLTHSFESAAAAKLQADSINRGEISTIRISLSHTIDFDLLASSLKELQQAFTGNQISLERGDPDEILNSLRTGDVEMAIAGTIDESWERLDVRPLFVENFCAAVSKNHEYAKRSSIKPDDLDSSPLVVRPYCENHKDHPGLGSTDETHQSQQYEVACDRDAVRLIEVGIGIGLLPASTRAGEGICKIPLSKALERTVKIYSVSGRKRSPALSGLMNLLRSSDWSRFSVAQALA